MPKDNYKKYFEVKEHFEIKDFDRKKELAMLRFNLSVKLATLLDKIATKRHSERCQILGLKFLPNRKK